MTDDEIDREIRMTAERLAIPVSDEWMAAIRTSLRATREASAFVEGFPLPDEADQAPVFEA